MSEKPDAPPEITRFLDALRRGAGARTEEQAEAEAELMPLVYEELRAIALATLRGRGADHTLHPTALVHETFLKLFRREGPGWNDRGHFYAVAARAMRQLLVDQARARGRRGPREADAELTLDQAVAQAAEFDFELLDLDEALSELERLDRGQARVVELRYFAGLAMSDVASALGTSLSTVEREWRSARAWLGARLGKAG